MKIGNIIENKNKKFYLLDPLSTIVKLCIISFKPSKTKISIWNNNITIQKYTMLQPFYRFFIGDCRTDLHYLSFPIEEACKYFLVETNPSIKEIVILFKQAKVGIQKLIDTYSEHHMIFHCLKFYNYVISNHLERINEKLELRKKKRCDNYHHNNDLQHDSIPELLEASKSKLINSETEIMIILNKRWTENKINMLIHLVNFVKKVHKDDSYNQDYVACIEKFLKPIERDSEMIIQTYYNK